MTYPFPLVHSQEKTDITPGIPQPHKHNHQLYISFKNGSRVPSSQRLTLKYSWVASSRASSGWKPGWFATYDKSWKKRRQKGLLVVKCSETHLESSKKQQTGPTFGVSFGGFSVSFLFLEEQLWQFLMSTDPKTNAPALRYTPWSPPSSSAWSSLISARTASCGSTPTESPHYCSAKMPLIETIRLGSISIQVLQIQISCDPSYQRVLHCNSFGRLARERTSRYKREKKTAYSW